MNLLSIKKLKPMLNLVLWSTIIILGVSATAAAETKKKDVALATKKTTQDDGPIHCVFIHGLNPYNVPSSPSVHYYTRENISDIINPLSEYWGKDVESWTTSGEAPCDTYAFAYMDTMDRAYTYTGNHTVACDAFQYTNKAKNEKAEKTKVFLHSMGNLIFWDAIAKGRCTISKADKDQKMIYSLAGPFGGAPIVEILDGVCDGIHTFEKSTLMKWINWIISGYLEYVCTTWWTKNWLCPWYPSEWNKKMNKVTAFTLLSTKDKEYVEKAKSFCDGASANKGVKSCNFTPEHNSALIEKAKTFGKGAVCGKGPKEGEANYILSEALLVLTNVANFYSGNLNAFNEVNDGVVPRESCEYPFRDAKFTTQDKSKNAFMTGQFAHSDMTGYLGKKETSIYDWLTSRD